MDRFKEKLVRFMQGRYGADELFYILSGLYLLLMLVNIFLNSWVLHLIGLVMLAMTVMRSLSSNIPARQKENALVMKLVGRFRRASASSRSKRDTKNYAYKKCPGCKKTLRLPRSKGRHNTRCPACGKEFSVKIR